MGNFNFIQMIKYNHKMRLKIISKFFFHQNHAKTESQLSHYNLMIRKTMKGKGKFLSTQLCIETIFSFSWKIKKI